MRETIYRLETSQRGVGIYRQDADGYSLADYLEEGVEDGLSFDSHPDPQEDFGTLWTNDEDLFFGFSSKEQLIEWTLSAERREVLVELGAVVRVYEGEVVLRSPSQLVFRWSTARLKRKENIPS